MFKNKKNLVIAITTADLDALRISVPPLRDFAHCATLVIYNDNSDTKLTRPVIKKLGWRGQVHIINADQACGELQARIGLMKFIVAHCADAEWTQFVNDTDVLINTEIPDVSKNAFAVVQNATILSNKVTDIFKISHKWATGTEYGKTGPRFDIAGPILRTMFLGEFCAFLEPLVPQIEKLAGKAHNQPSVGAIMWAALTAFMRARYPYTAPIYMNRTNYVAITMGTGTNDAHSKLLQKYNELFELAASENMVASAQ